MTASETLTVGIVLFPDVEVLDFAGPFEVFSVAARIAGKAIGAATPPFRVVTIAATASPVAARHGLKVVADHDFTTAPPIDLLIVPGGVMDQPLGDPATLDWVRETSARATLTASVCTGAFVLAEVGLLSGRTATTHWEDVADLRERFPEVTVVDDVPFVDEGAIITSAGISAGIAMSLHVVGRFAGTRLAELTAKQMQYDWQAPQQHG